jgi:hypothetical protein
MPTACWKCERVMQPEWKYCPFDGARLAPSITPSGGKRKKTAKKAAPRKRTTKKAR